MLLCLSEVQKKAESKTQRMAKANQRKINFFLNCALFESKIRHLLKKNKKLGDY